MSDKITQLDEALSIVANDVLPVVTDIATTPVTKKIKFSTLLAGVTPSGAAGGDLAGTYPNPTVPGLTAKVTGAASSTDNAIARFDGVTGKIVQNSAVTVADTSGNIVGGTYNANTIGAGSTSGTNTGDNAVNSLYSGLVTNATHTGDATGATALTLATVNSNVGSFTNADITVNAKGLITAAANGTGGGGADGYGFIFDHEDTNYIYTLPGYTFSVTNGTVTVSANRENLIPIYVAHEISFDEFNCEVTTGSAGNLRAGIYNHDPVTGRAGTLFQDFGTVSITAAAVKSIAITLTLTPGIWWLAVIPGSGATFRYWTLATRPFSSMFRMNQASTVDVHGFILNSQSAQVSGGLTADWATNYASAVATTAQTYLMIGALRPVYL